MSQILKICLLSGNKIAIHINVLLIRPKKYSCFRKCCWREKPSPAQPQIYFLIIDFPEIFSFLLDFILFSLILVFVCLFVCLFACCFLKLKMYVLIHIRLCGRVSDKKKFTPPISGNKTTFFLVSATILLVLNLSL